MTSVRYVYAHDTQNCPYTPMPPQDGAWDFTPGIGCRQCSCDTVGSSTATCNVTTGQCECKVGVGGRQCSECLFGFYNLTTSGCTGTWRNHSYTINLINSYVYLILSTFVDCSCSVAAVNNSCGFDGNCFCPNGTTGSKCDQCEPFYTDIGPGGCRPCDTCVTRLREENRRLNETLNGVDALSVQAAVLQGADTLDIDVLVAVINSIRIDFGNVNNSVTSLQTRLSTLQSQADTTKFNLTTEFAEVSNMY